MTRTLPITSTVALALAAASGCASLGPVPSPAAASPAVASPVAASPTAASPTAASSTAVPVAAAAPRPQDADRTAATVRPSVDRTSSVGTGARSGARTVATEKPGGNAAPRARAAEPSSSVRRPSATARAGSAAPGAEGPTVTTYTYSDAPSPRRREVPADDATQAAPARVPEGFNPYRIAFAPGAYRCELGRSVQVRSVSADLRTTVLRWGPDEYTLRAVDARSGALRYEDPAAGLSWIVLRDRAMLLDTRAGQRLANACRV
jgi:hypothetical protein